MEGVTIMSKGLDLNEVEERRALEFSAKHCGQIYYKVWNMGIGTKINICCEGCGLEQDITDYDCW